jgi:hypothetical protein
MSKKNECGGILAYVSKDGENAEEFCLENAHFL